MSLSSLKLAELDREVQRVYSKLGKKIPENHLYKITTLANIYGLLGTYSWAHYLGLESLPPIVTGGLGSGGLLHSCDNWYNILSLTGKFKTRTGIVRALDLQEEQFKNYNHAVRLPIFAAGVALMAKSIYGLATPIFGGENSDNSFTDFMNGTCFISLASSMYLKDQDPKLAEKEPVKTFNLDAIVDGLKDIYEGAKDVLKPSPLPTPEPVCSASLEKYLN